jgi:hypothetical protein
MPARPPVDPLPSDVVEDWIAAPPARDPIASVRKAIETLSYGDHYPSVPQTAGVVGL